MAEFPPKATARGRHHPPKSLLEAWERIKARFPKESDCLEELFRRAYEAGVIECPRCRHKKISKSYGQRRIRCKRCAKQWSFTAGTFFHRIRRARPWLAAILLLEEGVDVNSWQFHALAGIAYSTSWTTFQKIAAAILNVMDTLCNEAPSSMFSNLFGKRSRETPARQPPFAEQEEFDKRVCGDAAAACGQANPTDSPSCGNEQLPGKEAPQSDSKPPAVVTSDDLDAAVGAQWVSVYELLSAEPMRFDVLQARTGMAARTLSATLVLLEMDGAVVRLPGDWYVRATVVAGDDRGGNHSSPQTAETAINIAGILYVFRSTYQAISRKYLQPYLARYWCSKDRSRWSCGAVMQRCLQFGPISRTAILQYVSPAIVKVFAGA